MNQGFRPGMQARLVEVPTALGWTFTHKITQTDGQYAVNLDVMAYRPATAVTWYVDVATGVNTALGGTIGAPFRSIWYAINKAFNDNVAARIIVKAGLYTYRDCWQSAAAKDMIVEVVTDFTTMQPGVAISSVGYGPDALGAWTQTNDGGTPAADLPGVFQATLANTPYDVVDAAVPDANGVPTPLTSQGSIALVAANPGSWYHDDTGDKLYVHRLSGVVPDANVEALKASTINGHSILAVNLWVRGIRFRGGNLRAFYGQDFDQITMVDCQGELSQGEGISFTTTSAARSHKVRLVRCRSFANKAGDGLQYTVGGAGSVLDFLELDCVSGDNGRNAGANQGSSAHGTNVRGVRVNGRYLKNEAQAIADVLGAKSLNIGCVGDKTRAGAQGTGFYLGDTGKMWLLGCQGTIQTDNAGGTVYHRATKILSQSGPGTVTVW